MNSNTFIKISTWTKCQILLRPDFIQPTMDGLRQSQIFKCRLCLCKNISYEVSRGTILHIWVQRQGSEDVPWTNSLNNIKHFQARVWLVAHSWGKTNIFCREEWKAELLIENLPILICHAATSMMPSWPWNLRLFKKKQNRLIVQLFLWSICQSCQKEKRFWNANCERFTG